jgi:hypothetical protein
MDSTAPAQRSIWVTLEADEIIELKRVALDQDAQGAFDLFQCVVLPQVRARAQRCGICSEIAGEEAADGDLSR